MPPRYRALFFSDMKPLSGICIAVTRPAAQNAELVAPLTAAGAEVVVCPLIRIEPRLDPEALQAVREHFPEYAWLIFTSANGVDQFMHVVAEAHLPISGKQIACVGPATAAAAERHGLRTDSIPEAYTGEAVARTLVASGGIEGERILIARAAGGGEGLPRELRRAGALVDDFALYSSVPDEAGSARLQDLVSAGSVDVVTFTSGSAVRYFMQRIGVSEKLAIATIGPSTAAVARQLGLAVDIVADPHTSAGLARAILEYFAARSGQGRTDSGE